MLSNSEVRRLRRFISAQSTGESSPLDRLWAGRCAALLKELGRLEQQVQELTREVDTVLESRAGDTCII